MVNFSSCSKDIMVYTITWLLWAFSLVVDHDTHRDDVKSTSDHVNLRLHTTINLADFVSWWMWFNGSHTKAQRHFVTNAFCYPSYVYNMHQDTKSARLIAVFKQIDYIFPFVCTEDVTACKEQQSRHWISYLFVLYTLRRHLWSITVHTHGKM